MKYPVLSCKLSAGWLGFVSLPFFSILSCKIKWADHGYEQGKTAHDNCIHLSLVLSLDSHKPIKRIATTVIATMIYVHTFCMSLNMDVRKMIVTIYFAMSTSRSPNFNHTKIAKLLGNSWPYNNAGRVRWVSIERHPTWFWNASGLIKEGLVSLFCFMCWARNKFKMRYPSIWVPFVENFCIFVVSYGAICGTMHVEKVFSHCPYKEIWQFQLNRGQQTALILV